MWKDANNKTKLKNVIPTEKKDVPWTPGVCWFSKSCSVEQISQFLWASSGLEIGSTAETCSPDVDGGGCIDWLTTGTEVVTSLLSSRSADSFECELRDWPTAG
jgi:hypothetical protein